VSVPGPSGPSCFVSLQKQIIQHCFYPVCSSVIQAITRILPEKNTFIRNKVIYLLISIYCIDQFEKISKCNCTNISFFSGIKKYCELVFIILPPSLNEEFLFSNRSSYDGLCMPKIIQVLKHLQSLTYTFKQD